MKTTVSPGTDAPNAIADPQKIGSLQINISIVLEANVLRYKRQFCFGSGGRKISSAEAYQPLKTLFDAFHKADTDIISLKQKQ